MKNSKVNKKYQKTSIKDLDSLTFSNEDLAFDNIVNTDSNFYNNGFLNEIDEESEVEFNGDDQDETEINHDYKFDLKEEEIIRRYLKEKDKEMKEYCKCFYNF